MKINLSHIKGKDTKNCKIKMQNAKLFRFREIKEPKEFRGIRERHITKLLKFTKFIILLRFLALPISWVSFPIPMMVEGILLWCRVSFSIPMKVKGRSSVVRGALFHVSGIVFDTYDCEECVLLFAGYRFRYL